VLTLIPVTSLPLFEPGDAVADEIVAALDRSGEKLISGDVLVIAQKIVSKAEGRFVRLDCIHPGEHASDLARQTDKDPRLVELILREAHEVLRARPGLIVVEDTRGFVCANAGIDRSNILQHGEGEEVALLPVDPDASARAIRNRLRGLLDRDIAVIINDSHGRAWREGTVGVAIGVSGLPAIWDRRGENDLTGYTLQHTAIGIADELAAAASLLMGPAAEGVPAVVIRGMALPGGDGSARDLQRPRERDLFR
jgi:coenzyme F420-0:L-glutamate ligase/coenzyme F420-1:gamma-L-glutamate ligase